MGCVPNYLPQSVSVLNHTAFINMWCQFAFLSFSVSTVNPFTASSFVLLSLIQLLLAVLCLLVQYQEKVKPSKTADFEMFDSRKNSREAGIQVGGFTMTSYDINRARIGLTSC